MLDGNNPLFTSAGMPVLQIEGAFIYLLMLFSQSSGNLTQIGYYRDAKTCEKYSQIFAKSLAEKGMTVRGACIPIEKEERPVTL